VLAEAGGCMRSARVRWYPACVVVLVVVVLLAGVPILNARGAQPTSPSLMYTQMPCTAVYSAPSGTSTLLAQLLGGTDVRSLGLSQVGHETWMHIAIWSGVEGYAHANMLAASAPAQSVEGDCPTPGVPDPEPDILKPAPGPWTLHATGAVRSPATVFARPDFHALPVAALPVGTFLTIREWTSAADGTPWYAAHYAGGSGWVWAGNVKVSNPNPASMLVNGVPIWQPVAGKGMWFTNYFTRHADVNAIVQAAKKAGITHLYAEVAISQYGFYGRNSLDRLLPVAHAAGIAVIAWVYPVLHNVSADIRMTVQVAHYITPTGDRPDGIATDVEEVDDSASVYTYGQVVRALLGPQELMTAAVYHPYAEAYYPYAAIAASWNALAPMDYWHGLPHATYSGARVDQFVTTSIMTILASGAASSADPALPVEELGQMYDMYTGDGASGRASPTSSEIIADMRAAKDAGCIGVSFFEWQTATQQEWQALTSFSW